MSTVTPSGPQVPPPPPASTPPPWPPQQPAAGAGKPNKKWYKRKLVIAAAVIVVLAIAGSAMSKKKDTATTTTTAATAAPTSAGAPSTEAPATSKAPATTATPTTAKPRGLYPNRVDRQKEDQEVALGAGEVRLSGYTTIAKTAAFQQSVSEFESDGYIVADVTVLNRDDKAQPYNLFDWKLQTPGGQVLDADFTTLEGVLASGDLVKGGTVSGKVAFKVGAAKGQYFLIYKPDPFDSARGIWGVSI